MNNGIKLKKGDTLYPFYVWLADSNHNKIDLTGHTVTITMSKAGTKKINAAACTVVTAADGYIKYDFTSGDVDTADTYKAVFTVTETATSKTLTFPTDGYITVEIEDTL